jgi:hypothetical protein
VKATYNDRVMALLLLERTYHSVEHMAERLDPKRKRNPNDTVLKALDTVLNACARVLYQARAGVKFDGAELLSELWRPEPKKTKPKGRRAS